MRCGANDNCVYTGPGEMELEEQYDRYNIFAGSWHEECWVKFGYKDFVFDESYAGESLEEDY